MNINFEGNQGTINITIDEIKNINSELFNVKFNYEYKSGDARTRNVKNGIIGELITREYLKLLNYSIDKNYKEGMTESGFNYGDIKINDNKVLVTTKVFKKPFSSHLEEFPEEYAAFIKKSQIKAYTQDMNHMCLVFLFESGDDYFFKVIGFANGSEIAESIEKGETKYIKRNEYFSTVRMNYDNYVMPLTVLHNDLILK
jgi:hypothetical protein